MKAHPTVGTSDGTLWNGGRISPQKKGNPNHMFTITCITLSDKKKKRKVDCSYFRKKKSSDFSGLFPSSERASQFTVSVFSVHTTLAPVAVMLLGFSSLNKMDVGA